MKGMQKISRGAGFRGALNYAQDRDSPEAERGRLIGGNMSGQDAKALAAEFGLSRALRPDIAKPVWHNALRLPEGERIDPDRFVQMANDYMARMGFSDQHQRCYWLHDDAEGQHIHIVASRVGLDGSVYLGQNENLKSTQRIADLERAYGLTITPGVRLDAEGRIARPALAKLKKGEIEMALRTGEEPPKQKLQRIILEAKQDKPSAIQFAERLEAAGVTPVANLASTGKLNGFSFELDGIAFKGSQLGKAYGWGELSKEVTYDQTTDREALERFSAAARRRQIDAGATSGHRADAAAAADAREPRRLGQSAGAVGPSASQPERREQGGDPAGGAGSDQGSKDAGRIGPEPGEGNQGPGSYVPAVAEVHRGDGKGKAPIVLDPRFVFKPSDSGAYHRVLDLGGALVSNPNHKAKLSAWQQQHAALQAPAYRLTLTARRDDLKTYNMGKGKGEEGQERTYSAQEVAEMLPRLARQNARGYDVYITPIDPAFHYFVIDDMTPQGVRQLKGSGFTPALVQTSSQGNEQCILKVPRQSDQVDEQKLANQLVQHLNKQIGDPKFSGVIHPFRMAGFSNKKPGRGDFFTRILESGHRICGRAAQALEEMREGVRKRLQQAQDAKKQAEALKDREAQQLRLDALQRDGGTHQDNLCRGTYKMVLKQVEAAGWPLDMSKVDFRVAKHLHSMGLSDQTIERLLTAHSPSLHDRHSNADDYARRTVEAARQAIVSQIEQQEREGQAKRSRSDYDYQRSGGSISRPKG